MSTWGLLKHCYRMISSSFTQASDLFISDQLVSDKLIFDELMSCDLTNAPDVIRRSSEWLHRLSTSRDVFWISCASMKAGPHVTLASADYFALSGIEILPELIQHCSQAGSQSIKFNDYLIVPIFDPRNANWLGSFLLQDAKAGVAEFSSAVSLISTCLSYAFAFESIRQLSYKDDVTSLYNQRYLPLVLSQEMSRAARDKRNVSVLFLDVDFFKAVNDANGHLVGSQVLVQIGEVLRQCTRNYDYVFRYGGDEFVVVLPNATSSQALDVAERIRAQVAASSFLVHGVSVQVTVSIGVATYPDHAQSAEQVLHLADQAMYYGKNTSRNVVYMAT